MPTAIIKEEAHKIIDQLPAGATWDDLMHELYVREAIELGLADSKAGRTKDVQEIRAKYRLPDIIQTMKKIRLSKEEKEIENALLDGEFKPLKGKELEKIESALKARKKDITMTIRVNSEDIEKIKDNWV